MNRVRSTRPISRNAQATGFWLGYGIPTANDETVRAEVARLLNR